MPKPPSPKPAIRHLNLHREFFAQIAAGTMRTKYRAHACCWRRRLEDVITTGSSSATGMRVEFRRLQKYRKGRNGYHANAPVQRHSDQIKPKEGVAKRMAETFHDAECSLPQGGELCPSLGGAVRSPRPALFTSFALPQVACWFVCNISRSQRAE